MALNMSMPLIFCCNSCWDIRHAEVICSLGTWLNILFTCEPWTKSTITSTFAVRWKCFQPDGGIIFHVHACKCAVLSAWCSPPRLIPPPGCPHTRRAVPSWGYSFVHLWDSYFCFSCVYSVQTNSTSQRCKTINKWTILQNPNASP